MKNVLKLEIKKAIKNTNFLVCILIGSMLCIASAVMQIQAYEQHAAVMGSVQKSKYIINTMLEVETFYNSWIGMDGFSLFNSLFYTFMPLICTLPFAWSYNKERNICYEHNMVIRCGRNRYYAAKYLATFISGGLAVLLPIVINVLLVAMVIPGYTSTIDYALYIGIQYPMIWSQIFYTNPLLYVILYLLLTFIFCGLMAAFGMCISYFTRNKVAALIVPFFVCSALGAMELLFAYNKDGVTLSPVVFLHPTPIGGYQNAWWVILLEGGILTAFTIISTYIRGRKHEIY